MIIFHADGAIDYAMSAICRLPPCDDASAILMPPPAAGYAAAAMPLRFRILITPPAIIIIIFAIFDTLLLFIFATCFRFAAFALRFLLFRRCHFYY